MAMKPCLVCGVPSSDSRCPAHTLRKGSTRSWRRVRAQVLERDSWRCQLCGRPAVEVDHVVPHAAGGTDQPSNLRSLCHVCHVGS